jgi:hypothetical protein
MVDKTGDKRDWRVSAVLLAVWIVALVIVVGRRDDIPLSMIGLATLFFILLIPSMNDLVRSLEKRVEGDRGDDRDS